ncbi:MAG: Ppx/GppA family phosphatase [Pirellulaceae bacterium]|nr:Ppx/GppA family phosphatase [Pirellulaceae bacterium]
MSNSDSIDASTTILPRFAAIDIGSNSVRLEIVEVLQDGATYRILDEERVSTRLVSELSQTGKLSPQAVADTLEALKHFKKIAAGYEVEKIEAIATCAVREATNGHVLCRLARDQVDLEIRVISAEEEARLAFESVKNGFDLQEKNILVIDMGGGSTECILAADGLVEAIFKTALGAVRLTKLQSQHGEISNFSSLQKQIQREIKQKIGKVPFYPQIVYGSGGTFTTVASILMAKKNEKFSQQGYRIKHAEVHHLLKELSKMSLEKREEVAGLSRDRADIIVAGVAVIDQLMQHFRVNLLQVHQRGVRDGLILKMLAKAYPHSSQEKGEDPMIAFAQKCGVDLEHAKHVAELSRQLFRPLQKAYPLLEEKHGHLLEAAAILQDVGYLINYEKHHQHSYHLILHSQLPFAPLDLRLIANVARYHRGARPKKKHLPYRQLSLEERQIVCLLSAILRLAGSLDRSHTQSVKNADLVVEETQVVLTLIPKEGASIEVDYWAAQKRSYYFERQFGLPLRLRKGESV